MSDSILVVELGFGNRVVHVDRREQKFSALEEFVKSVNTSGGFFANTDDFRSNSCEALWVFLQ